MSDLIITNARLIDADRDERGGLRVADGRIAELLSADMSTDDLGALALRHDADVTDANGLWLIPGGVDPHVHFALPVAGTVTIDDFASGSKAALAGGTTTFIDFITPAPGTSLIAATEARLAEAETSACDYSFHMTVTSWGPDTAAEMKQCRDEFGLTSVKLYLAYLESIGLEDDDLFNAMRAAANLGLTVLLHCEDGHRVSAQQQKLLAAGRRGPDAHPDSRPAEYEEASVRHAIKVAERAGCRIYVVHASTIGAVEAVARARDEGQDVLIETCPQYLLLDDSRYRGDPLDAAACIMSPPLRTVEHGMALRKAVLEGLIDTIGTDHCSFTRAQKNAAADFTKIPGGAAGVQHRLGLLAAAVPELSPRDWVKLVSASPARAFGLNNCKGQLQIGCDADLVLWNPEPCPTITHSDEHRCDHSIYFGMTVKGESVRIWRRGKVFTRSHADQPGLFLPRTTSP